MRRSGVYARSFHAPRTHPSSNNNNNNNITHVSSSSTGGGGTADSAQPSPNVSGPCVRRTTTPKRRSSSSGGGKTSRGRCTTPATSDSAHATTPRTSTKHRSGSLCASSAMTTGLAHGAVRQNVSGLRCSSGRRANCVSEPATTTSTSAATTEMRCETVEGCSAAPVCATDSPVAAEEPGSNSHVKDSNAGSSSAHTRAAMERPVLTSLSRPVLSKRHRDDDTEAPHAPAVSDSLEHNSASAESADDARLDHCHRRRRRTRSNSISSSSNSRSSSPYSCAALHDAAQQNADNETGALFTQQSAPCDTHTLNSAHAWHLCASSPLRTRQSRDAARRVVYYPPVRASATTAWTTTTTTTTMTHTPVAMPVAAAADASFTASVPNEAAVTMCSSSSDACQADSSSLMCKGAHIDECVTARRQSIADEMRACDAHLDRLVSHETNAARNRESADADSRAATSEDDETHANRPFTASGTSHIVATTSHDQYKENDSTWARHSDDHVNHVQQGHCVAAADDHHVGSCAKKHQTAAEACTFLRALALQQQQDVAPVASLAMSEGGVSNSPSETTPSRRSGHDEETMARRTLHAAGTPARATSSSLQHTSHTAPSATRAESAPRAEHTPHSRMNGGVHDESACMTYALAATCAVMNKDMVADGCTEVMHRAASSMTSPPPPQQEPQEPVLFFSFPLQEAAACADANTECTSHQQHDEAFCEDTSETELANHTPCVSQHHHHPCGEAKDSAVSHDASAAHSPMPMREGALVYAAEEAPLMEREDDLAREMAEDIRMSADMAFTPDTAVAETNHMEWSHNSNTYNDDDRVDTAKNNNNNEYNNNDNSIFNKDHSANFISMSHCNVSNCVVDAHAARMHMNSAAYPSPTSTNVTHAHVSRSLLACDTCPKNNASTPPPPPTRECEALAAAAVPPAWSSSVWSAPSHQHTCSISATVSPTCGPAESLSDSTAPMARVPFATTAPTHTIAFASVASAVSASGAVHSSHTPPPSPYSPRRAPSFDETTDKQPPQQQQQDEDAEGITGTEAMRSPQGSRLAGRTVFRLLRTHEESERVGEETTCVEESSCPAPPPSSAPPSLHVSRRTRFVLPAQDSTAPTALSEERVCTDAALCAKGASPSPPALAEAGAGNDAHIHTPPLPHVLTTHTCVHTSTSYPREDAGETRVEANPEPHRVTAMPAAHTFYDLPLAVGELFARLRGVRTLFDWQQEVLQREDVRRGDNFVYSLPTSGGKTLVAEIILLRALMLRRRSCFFVLPFVSLAEEKAHALKPFAAAFHFNVDGHYGMTGGFPLPRGPTVFVCTIEKANSVLNHMLDENVVDEVGAVVVDELHMLGESRRGATLELFLSKLLWLQRRHSVAPLRCGNDTCATHPSDTSPSHMERGVDEAYAAGAEMRCTALDTYNSSPARCTAAPLQIVGMSATVPNLAAIAHWLGAAYYESDHRPVPLRHYSVVNGMIMRDGCVHERNLTGASESEWLCELATELPEASVLIFCASRQQCVQTARSLVRYLQLAAAPMDPLDGQPRIERAFAPSVTTGGVTGESVSHTGKQQQQQQQAHMHAPDGDGGSGSTDTHISDTAQVGAMAGDGGSVSSDAEAAVHAMLAESGVTVTHATQHALAALPRSTAAHVGLLLAELAHLSHTEAAQLSELVPYGVAFHHGGLLTEERDLIERAYRVRCIRWLCCTSTLAAGVNLPARRVVLKTPHVGRDFLTKSRYMQMCGRAGRAGLDVCGESFLLLRPRDGRRGLALMQGALEPCSSQMLEDFGGFMRALLECVGVRLVDSMHAARGWVRCLLGPHAPGPVEQAVRLFLRPSPQKRVSVGGTGMCGGVREMSDDVHGRGDALHTAEADGVPCAVQLVSCGAVVGPCDETNESYCHAPTTAAAAVDNIHSAERIKKHENVDEAELGPSVDDNGWRLTASHMNRLLTRALDELVRCELVRRGSEEEMKKRHPKDEGGGSWANSFVTTSASVTLPSCHKPTDQTNSGEFYSYSDDDTNNNNNNNEEEEDVCLRTTAFGASAVRSCFSVEEALVVRDEFNQLRHTGLILADDLHLSYFLTPLREVGNCDWELYRRILGRLSDTRQHIANLVGVDERFVHQRAMGLGGGGGDVHAIPTSEPAKRTFFVARRFYVALMLADVLAEVPLEEVERRYNVSRGQLQSLMRSASMFSGSMTSFCHAMEWYSLEAVLASFVKRLDFGVKPDLVPLMEIRGVQPARARALWVAGFRDAKSIATAEVEDMVHRVKTQNAPECKSAKFFTRRSAVALIRRATAYLQEQIKRRRGELDALAEETTSHGNRYS